jgi:hypothetical protein
VNREKLEKLYKMQELYDKITNSNSNLITLSGIIYSTTHHVFKPIVKYDSDVWWVYLDASLVNDVKRIIKYLDKHNMVWFYISTGCSYDALVTTVDFHINNYWNLIRFAFPHRSGNYSIYSKNIDALDVVNKAIEASKYFNNVETLIKVIDRFDMAGINKAYRNRYIRLHDPTNKMLSIRRQLTIGLIIN